MARTTQSALRVALPTVAASYEEGVSLPVAAAALEDTAGDDTVPLRIIIRDTTPDNTP